MTAWNFSTGLIDGFSVLGLYKRVSSKAYRYSQLPSVFTADPNGGAFVKEALAVKYLGPLQADWYNKKDLKGVKNKAGYQTLNFKSFAETNKVWHPMNVFIVNAKGKIQVNFTKAEAAFAKKAPKDLYEFAP